MKFRLTGTFTAVAIVLLFAGQVIGEEKGGNRHPRPVLGAELVKRLLDPKSRSEAFYEFILAYEKADPQTEEKWKDAPRSLFARAFSEVDCVACPVPAGSPELFLLTYHEDYGALVEDRPSEPIHRRIAFPDHPEETKRRLAWAKQAASKVGHRSDDQSPWDPLWRERVLVFLDADGRICWPFGGNNAIGRGVIGDLNGDGAFERIDYTNWGVEKGSEVQSMEVSTVEREPRSLFHVIFNWHPRKADKANRWGFDVTDRDGDGIAEIELGPGDEDYALVGEAEAVFRWDSGTGTYIGPPGGKGKHWRALSTSESNDIWKTLEAQSGLGYPLRSDADKGPAGKKAPSFLPWPERDPYQHRSLAGLSDEELMRFMAKGRGHPADEERPEPFREMEYAEVPLDVVSMSPKEAALALAEANRTPEHRQRYELRFAPGEDDETPPKSGVVVVDSRGGGWTPTGVHVDSLRYDGDFGEWVRCHYGRKGRYPNWRGDFAWDRREVGAKARWVGDTLWWLNRLRTVSKFDHEVLENSPFTADDIPSFQLIHTTTPNEENPAGVNEFPSTQGFDGRSRWRGHYDRRVATTLALGLSRQLFSPGTEKSSVPRDERDLGVVQQVLNGQTPLKTWPIPDVLRLAVATAGDRGWASLDKAVSRLNEQIGIEPGELESNYRRWSTQRRTALDAWMAGDQKAYERKKEADEKLVPLEMRARIDPGVQLRDAIQLTTRQFAAAQDREALQAWANDKESDGAAWALRRLETFDRGAAEAETILVDQVEKSDDEAAWLFSKLLDRNLDRAIESWRAMPDEQRHLYTVALVSRLDAVTQEKPEWVDVLTGLLRLPLAAQYRGAAAVTLLVPRDEPMRLPDAAIDETLAEALETVNESGELNYAGERLREEAVFALARRDRAREYWPLLIETHERAQEDDSGDDISIRSALVKIVAKHPDLRQELWLRLRLKDVHGRWNTFFLDAFAADLKLAKDDFARAATLSSDEPEGPRANSWVSSRETLKGGFHRARQVIALWDEPDEATRAKMKVVLGLRAMREFNFEDFYTVTDRVEDDLAEIIAALGAVEKAELGRWIDWCGGAAAERELGEPLWPAQRAWLDELKANLSIQ